jgi:CubicO group peptidase (beta-lactamase class C family)
VKARPQIDGHVAPGFEPVLEVFLENFNRRDELGGAVAVFRGEQCLVDVWGGVADRKRSMPWQRNTPVLMFSTTKGLTGLTLAHAHSRRLFAYDDPVARYWPEFGTHGKESITIRQLLSHQAGLAAIDAVLTPEILADPDRRDVLLASQAPAWTPGKFHGYHATSFGFYASALLRRCDPRARGVAAYFDQEIARPLGANFWIGLPRDFDVDRLARIDSRPALRLPGLSQIPLRFMWSALNRRSLTMRALTNPPVRRVAELDSPLYWYLEHPSTIGLGEVRAVAKIYAEFARGGGMLEIDPDSLAALEQGAKPTDGQRDLVLHMQKSYAVGLSKPTAQFPFGSSNRAYGSAGMGGSFGFADPDLGVGFAYASNRLGLHITDDPREKALRDSIYRCLSSTALNGST